MKDATNLIKKYQKLIKKSARDILLTKTGWARSEICLVFMSNYQTQIRWGRKRAITQKIRSLQPSDLEILHFQRQGNVRWKNRYIRSFRGQNCVFITTQAKVPLRFVHGSNKSFKGFY